MIETKEDIYDAGLLQGLIDFACADCGKQVDHIWTFLEAPNIGMFRCESCRLDMFMFIPVHSVDVLACSVLAPDTHPPRS